MQDVDKTLADQRSSSRRTEKKQINFPDRRNKSERRITRVERWITSRGIDRRKGKRYQLNTPVMVSDPWKSQSTITPKDIGKGGLFISATNGTIDHASKITLSILIPGTNQPISLDTKVIHTDGNEGVGIKFIEGPALNKLHRFLDKYERSQSKDFYQKFMNVSERLSDWEKRYKYFRQINSGLNTRVTTKDQELLMFGSNNYLGLANHPKVKEAAINAIKKYGTGTGSTSVLSGSLSIHETLQSRIAEFKGMESALLFGTGFTANLGVISTLFYKDYILINDEKNHVSIFEGCKRSRSRVRIYRHNDMEHLEKVLKLYQGSKDKKVIIVESVFSMDGDLARLPEIVWLAEKHNAAVVVDEAHASGILGKNGRGSIDFFNLIGRVDVITDSFGKAFASIGGYVASSKEVTDYIKHFSSASIFTTSLPPSVCATILAVIDVLENEPEIIDKFWENAQIIRQGLRQLGFNIGTSNTHIIPVILGDEAKTYQFCGMLQEYGVFVSAVGRPAVKRGEARLRVSVMASHEKDELAKALEVFESVGKKLRVI